MRSLSRALRTLMMAVLALEAVYLVGANTALLLVPGVANSAPDQMNVSFQAFSPFPGLMLVRDFSMRAQDPFVQWQLDVKRARVWLELRSLRDQVFHARQVDASGVAFRVRRKVAPEDVTPELTLSQPPIEGYGPVGLRDDRPMPSVPEQLRAWTIRMDRVSADAHELWIDLLRYEGPLHARGAWALHLDQEAWVGPAQLELQGGTVSRASQKVGANLRGTIDATVDTFPVFEVPGAKILDYVDAKLALSGALQDVAGLASALGASEKLAIAGSPGRFKVDGRLQKGVLEPGTTASAEIPRATMKVGGLRAAGGARTTARVAEDGRIHIDVNGERLSLRDPDTGVEFVRGAAVHLSSHFPGNDLRSFVAPRRAQLTLTRSVIPKLSALNQVIPDPLGFEIQGGRGTVTGKLDVNLARGTGSGSVDVRMREVALRQEKDTVKGHVDVRLSVSGVRPDLRSISLAGTTVKIRDMQVTSARTQRAWNGEVEVSQASLDLDRREMFRGKLDLRFEDARPLFRTMLDRTQAPRWAKRLFVPNDVRAVADIGFGRGWVRVDALNAHVGRTRVTGVARLTREKHDGAARMSAGILSAGLEVRGGKRSFKLLPTRNWFAKQHSRVTGRQGG